MERFKMISTKVFQAVLVASTVGLLSGCGGPSLSKKARAGVNSVSINTEVSMPREMSYAGTASQTGAFFGLIGGLVAGAAEKSPREEMMKVMQENDIDPGKIAAAQFREQLKAKRVFPSVVEAGGDAKFVLEVKDYGFFYKPYTNRLKPVLRVAVYLEKAGGKRVWKNEEWTTSYTKGTDSYTHEQYIASPELLRKVFEQAANVLVVKFVKNLQPR